ncbi:hypothetical protein EYF80_001174 [Liparis tanakae]|uniref:Uncharacterized protein n=1 Tax=Liparis tanakae TaxID=230148 RepID=A0A4Z2JGM3_9TELE|nr:hypothetical protein EYF80_001174 [Liparis tanakae]
MMPIRSAPNVTFVTVTDGIGGGAGGVTNTGPPVRHEDEHYRLFSNGVLLVRLMVTTLTTEKGLNSHGVHYRSAEGGMNI